MKLVVPKRCQKCKLREILNEMREAYVVQTAEKQKSKGKVEAHN